MKFIITLWYKATGRQIIFPHGCVSENRSDLVLFDFEVKSKTI